MPTFYAFVLWKFGLLASSVSHEVNETEGALREVSAKYLYMVWQ